MKLRKQRLFDYFSQKRTEKDMVIRYDTNPIVINPNQLNLTQEEYSFAIKDIENTETLMTLMQMLTSININLKHYAIYQLRTYFEANTPLTMNLIKESKVIELLIDLLNSDYSINIQNEIYWILINFSYCEGKAATSSTSTSDTKSNYLDVFALEENISTYNKSLLLMNKELNRTITHFMLIIAGNSVKCRYALFNDTTMPLLLSLYEQHCDSGGYDTDLILLYGVLVKKQKNIFQIYLKRVYDILTSILLMTTTTNAPNPEMVFCCLFGLVNLSDYINTLWPLFSSRAIEEKLIDFILNYDYNDKDNGMDNQCKDYSNDNSNSNSITLMHSIQLLMNLLLSEDINMNEYLLSKHILNFLMKAIENHSSSTMILKEVLSTLKNISVGLIDEITQLISHPIFQHCIALLSHHNLSIKIEATSIISNCLQYKVNATSMKIYSNNLIGNIINIFNSNTDSTLILNSLMIIYLLILSDDKNTHYFIYSLQYKHIEDLIQNYLLSTNKDINIISNAIINHITLV